MIVRNELTEKYLSKDEYDFLINDTNSEKISAEFLPIINEVQHIIVNTLHESIHSIYLSGSIPRGVASPGVSDLDIFAILKPNYYDDSLAILQEKCRALLSTYHVVSKIDVEVWSFIDIFPLTMNPNHIQIKETLSEFEIILKIASLCIFGNDLSQFIPPIKPSIALANDEISRIKMDIDQAKTSILAAKNTSEVNYWCKRVMKNIVRGGFCLCIPTIKEYTRDINLCTRTFAKNFPNYVHDIEKALFLIKNPSSNALDIIKFLDDFGPRLMKEVERWLDQYNPQRFHELARDR